MRRATRASELIAAVGLTGFERYYPHELSGGMRKRAALIRTLVYDPPIILMDEPFAAVDAQTRTQLQQDLLQLWSLKRKTILFVTHDITEAIALGDRALVLTRRPARIAAEHPIPIPRPRNVKDIFTMPGFTGDLRAHPGGRAMKIKLSTEFPRVRRLLLCPCGRGAAPTGRTKIRVRGSSAGVRCLPLTRSFTGYCCDCPLPQGERAR